MNSCNLCAHFTVELAGIICPECGNTLAVRRREGRRPFGGLAEYRQITLRTNQPQDPISRRLPPEIVSRIFEMYSTYDLPGYRDRSEQCEFMEYSPLQLGAICRAWRRIAWSTPTLWTFLEIDLDSGMFDRPPPEILWPAGYEIARDWLGRTGCLPLQLRVFSDADYQLADESWGLEQLCFVIDLINAYSSRWQYLDLSLPKFLLQRIAPQPLYGRPPILKTVRVKITDEDESDELSYTMTMQDLCPMEVRIENIRYESLVINWSNLTMLYAEDLYSDEVLRILAHAPLLVSCVLFNAQIRENPIIPSPLPIVHHSLRTLVSSSGYCEGHDLFSHIILPNVIFLDIESFLTNDTNLIPCLGGFLRLCTPSVEILVLHLPEIPLTEISDLLHEVHSVRNLILSRDFEPEMWSQFFKSVGRRPSDSEEEEIFLPNLRNLEFEYPADRGPSVEGWDIVLETLQAAISDCDTDFCRDAHRITIMYSMEAVRDKSVGLDQIRIPFKLKHLLGLSNLILAGMPLQIGLEPHADGKIRYIDFIGLRDEFPAAEIEVVDQDIIYEVDWYTRSTTSFHLVNVQT